MLGSLKVSILFIPVLFCSFYLSANKKALAKFVKCVNWNVPGEAMLALDLIVKWAPMDVEDALELLGPSFRHSGVRQYAVDRLQRSPDDDLQMYLLQLVQVTVIRISAVCLTCF